MKHLYLWLVLAVTCVMLACSEDKVESDKDSNLQTEIHVDTNTLIFNQNESVKLLEFSTNKDWTISIASTINGSHWCNVSRTIGQAGDISVEIYVDANDGYDDRNVVITIQAGELSKTIMVTQKQKDALTLTADRFEVGQEGGTIHVEVKSNISYEVVIPDEYKGWISQNRNARGLNVSNVSFEIAPSEEYDKREGEIIIQSGYKKEIVKVYQSGGAILLLSQNVHEVGPEGGLIQVEIKSNFDFEIEIKADWVSTSYSRNMSSHTIYFTVFANGMYEDRQTDIIFYQRNSDIRDTLTIYQDQQDTFLPNVKEYCFSKEGGQIKHLFRSNVFYEVKVPSEYSWISIPQSRGLRNHSVTINVSKNTSDAFRSGYILLNSVTGAINDTIKIYQGSSLVLQVDLPGTLSSLITQSGVDKWNITDLTLSGNLNGADIRCIREMAGGFDFWVENWNLLPTKGHLASLDISDCHIIRSNEPYYNSSVIRDNDCLSESMFSGLPKLRRIILPNSVVKMEKNVLSDCYALTEVTLPYNLVTMEFFCFDGCLSLKEIFIPDNVKTIFHFGICPSLETVNINNAVFDYDNENPFPSCSSLKNIIVSDRNPNHVCIDGVLYTKESNKLLCYPNIKMDRSYMIEDGTKVVVRSAFQGNQYIESLVIPNSVTEIGEYAFSGTSLKNILLPSGLKRIESGLFDGSALESIIVPEGIEYIHNAFEYCKGLRTIYLPSTIKSIGSRAFQYCNLSEIHCKSKFPLQIDWISNWLYNLGNPIIYVPKGSKELYENANYWKNYEIREE